MIEKVLSLISPQYGTTPTEDLIRDILESTLRHCDTKLIRSFSSEVYYITNFELDYYIKLDRVSITISNHTYTFREGLTEQFCKILYKVIDVYTESMVKKFEEEVFKNKTDLLNRIKDKLQNRSWDL